jgi:hypothetical protein
VRDRAWLERFIAKPDQVLADGDPTAKALYEKYEKMVMPSLGLGPEDVQALIGYIGEEGGGPGSAAQPRGEETARKAAIAIP